MELVGKITETDLDEVRKMVRPKMYWPKLLLTNLYGILLLGAIVWVTILGLVGSTKPNWRAIEITWLVIAGIVAWSFYRAKRGTAREFNELNAKLPDRIDLTNDGIKFNGPDGATGFRPWTQYKGWREGQRVLLVEQSQSGFVILPVQEFSDIQRQALRQLLDSHFPLSGSLSAHDHRAL